MKRLLLALVAVVLAATPAAAWPVHGVAGGSGNSPNVLPGATSGNCVLTDACSYTPVATTYAGSSGDVGYSLPVVARWAAPQRIEVGYFGAAGANQSRQIGLLAFHQPTNAEMAAGHDDNVCSVDVAIDGGATYTITGPTWNASDLETDWNFTATNANFSDGYHRVDAVIKPCTGPSLVMSGPLEYSLSDHSGSTSTAGQINAGASISDGTGAAAGNVLTISDGATAADRWRVGWDVGSIGFDPNTRITARGTGTGGPGTYTVSGPPQLIGGSVFTGSISGGMLTVTALSSGVVQQFQPIHASGVTMGTVIQNAVFDGSISGNTLTVTLLRTGGLGVGQTISGVAANTTISALGTGTGGAGTYTVSVSQTAGTGTYTTVGTGTGGVGTYPVTVSQAVASRGMIGGGPATGAIHKSFWFITNAGGTLNRYVEYVSASGSDSNTGDSTSLPKLTIGQAAFRIWARTPDSGKYGGVICVQGGGTFWANQASPTGLRPGPLYGWLETVKAESDPRCGVAGSPSDPIINTDTGQNTGTGANGFERWSHLTVNGGLEGVWGTWVDYVTGHGFGLNWQHSGHQQGLLVFSATACTNSVAIGYESGCQAEIVRNTTEQFVSEDFTHGLGVVVNNTFKDGGNVWLRVTGTATIGSNVITGVSVPAGFTIGQLLATWPNGGTMDVDVAGCFSAAGVGAVVSAIDEVAHTVTVVDDGTHTAANATCTATGSLSSPGLHGDVFQYDSLSDFQNVILIGNTADDGTNGYQQGLFSEVPVNGLVYKNNAVRTLQTTEFYINVANYQYNWTLSGDTWNQQGTNTSGFNLNGSNHRYWLDINNACTGTPASGGLRTYTPAGTNVRLSGGSCR